MTESGYRPVAQLARAPVSKTGGWGFKSLLACHSAAIARRGNDAVAWGSTVRRGAVRPGPGSSAGAAIALALQGCESRVA